MKGNEENSCAVVVFYPKDWEWALSTEVAIYLQQHYKNVVFYDFGRIGHVNLKEFLRNFFSKTKTRSSCLKLLQENSIKIIRPKNSIWVKFKSQFKFFYFTMRPINQHSTKFQNIFPEIANLLNREIINVSRHFFLIRRYKKIEYQVLNSFDKLELESYSLLVSVNGRFTKSRTFVNHFRNLKKIVYLIEFGSNPESFDFYKKNPHSMSEHHDKLIGSWNTGSKNKIEVAKQYFIKMRTFDPVARKNWTEKMKPHQLPDGFNKFEKNAVFFASSQRELIAVADEINQHNFKSQYEAFDQICQLLDGSEWKIYLRLHPSTGNKDKDEKEIKPWLKYMHKFNIEIIQANSNVDSFELAKNCTAVFHFNSSIGPQLIFEGHQTVFTMGPTMWYSLFKEHQTENIESLKRAIRMLPKIKYKDQILPWGYYRATRGIKFTRLIFNSSDSSWSITENF